MAIAAPDLAFIEGGGGLDGTTVEFRRYCDFIARHYHLIGSDDGLAPDQQEEFRRLCADVERAGCFSVTAEGPIAQR